MIQGSIVALVTPITMQGDIDWPALTALVDWHIQEKTDAIVVAGTTGESATLTVTEHCQLIKAVVDQVAGRIPVIAGTGANATQEAIELTQAAKSAKADACLLVTPYYNKPSQEGLIAHYQAIAKAVAIPQILYNVPSRTACDLLPETVLSLSKVPNIIGIKEATGDVERGRLIREQCDDTFALFSGDDATFIALMALGAVANISVTANVVPKRMHDICRHALEGDMIQAQHLNTAVESLHACLFVEANPIPVKWALQTMGKIQPCIRLPLTPLNPMYHQRVLDAMQEAGVTSL